MKSSSIAIFYALVFCCIALFTDDLWPNFVSLAFVGVWLICRAIERREHLSNEAEGG